MPNPNRHAEPRGPKKNKLLTFQISRGQLAMLERCLAAMQDLFALNAVLDESRARLRNKERKMLERFTYDTLDWLTNLKKDDQA